MKVNKQRRFLLDRLMVVEDAGWMEEKIQRVVYFTQKLTDLLRTKC